MKIVEFDKEVFLLSVPFYVIGFGLVWWQTSFLCAVGVVLFCFASGIRRA